MALLCHVYPESAIRNCLKNGPRHIPVESSLPASSEVCGGICRWGL